MCASVAADASVESSPADPIVNVSCYKFVPLDQLDERRQQIRRITAELNLKGTVLLSREGINLFVAGFRSSINQFVDSLRTDPALADLQPKESLNQYQPFNRMLVKIKREIISFGVDSVDPVRRTSPKLSAAELKRWLDEGRPVHLLDVRNDYEYDLGTFDNAICMHLDHFREFPDAVGRLPDQLRNEPVVMFCTGGIRCEKAGPYMEQAGFQQVYQLDGGILKYFEEVGGDHYHGECFVFDQRVGVDPSLKETPTTQCYICQEVVTPAAQLSPQYVPGKSCPACYMDEAQRLAARLQKRQQQLLTLIQTLPGSEPYFNRRPLNVPERFDGMSLLNFLDTWHPQVGRDEWLQRIQNSLIVPGSLHGRRLRRRKAPLESLPLSPERTVRAGERFDHLQPGTTEPDVNAEIEFLYEDEDLIVLHKPAPLPMHASGRFHRNTLRYLINELYHPERPHMVHRLDANTSGVLVLCRRKSVARRVQVQFENRTVSKLYLARVHGHPEADQFRCDAPLARDPEEAGIRPIAAPGEGDAASTEFEVVARLADGTSLLKVRPLTGRTNQIRAHLWHLGHAICGDPAWLQDGALGSNRTLSLHELPMCLHAQSIRFTDADGTERTFEAATPQWWSADSSGMIR
jgi:UPF0176 protein